MQGSERSPLVHLRKGRAHALNGTLVGAVRAALRAVRALVGRRRRR